MRAPDNPTPPEDPAEALAAVVALRRMADRLERAAIDEALARGWTWTQVAEALGMTRQAAHKRHAPRIAAARKSAAAAADDDAGGLDVRQAPKPTA